MFSPRSTANYKKELFEKGTYAYEPGLFTISRILRTGDYNTLEQKHYVKDEKGNERKNYYMGYELQLVDHCPLQMLVANEFEDARVGILRRAGQTDIVIYSYQRCVEILKERENLSEEEAEEWMEYNVLGSWMGDGTPGFVMNE